MDHFGPDEGYGPRNKIIRRIAENAQVKTY